MTKAQITKVGNYWRLIYYTPSRNGGLQAKTQHFMFADGAYHQWFKVEAQATREQKAFAKLINVDLRLLTNHEYLLVMRLKNSSCINITKRQYGYLTGILERQQGV